MEITQVIENLGIEKAAVDEKVANLENFLYRQDEDQTISNKHRNLLISQKVAMELYSSILQQRIDDLLQ